MNEPTEVPPNAPPDWRDWVNEWPSIKAVAFLCFLFWIGTGVMVGVAGWWGFYTKANPPEGVLKILDSWLNALLWLTGAAVFGTIGKFATTKPDVIRAEGEVKAAMVVAAQTAASDPLPRTSPSTPPTGTDPDIARVLTEEAERRRVKHKLSSPVEGEGG